MSEEQIEWRDAWKKLIDASREMILNGKKDDTSPFDKLTSLQDDKMLLFEKAIAFECLGNKDRAIELYKAAADENNGLPVAHWRKRAKYFYDRLEEGVVWSSDLNTNQDVFNVQWDLYFNLHYYANLDDYIRYLAISSVSRIGSEPAMAIVIFRTCLEIGLWTYFEKEANAINEDYKRKHYKKNTESRDMGLNYLLDHMNDKPYNLFKPSEFKIINIVRTEGNKAVHPGTIKKTKPFVYQPDDLKYIMDYFNQMMRFFNEHTKKLTR